MAEPILDISTEPKANQPFIRIDGENYPMADIEGMTARQQIRIDAAGKSIGLMDAETITDEELENLEKQMEEVCGMILPTAPPDKIGKLGLIVKGRIIGAFTREIAKNPLFAAGLSQDSKGSTAGTQPTG